MALFHGAGNPRPHGHVLPDVRWRVLRDRWYMASVVSAIGLTKRFGDVTAVRDLSFDVEAGTVTGFLGPNGAGKTTTLRVLLGLAEPTSGEALVFGRRFAELDRPATRVGAVLEAADVHPGRTGRDHLRVLAAAARVPSSRVAEVLAFVDLAEAADRRVAGYSLGMRQRLAVAAALLGSPELLILDEPTNGLDPEGIRWLHDFLLGFAAAWRHGADLEPPPRRDRRDGRPRRRHRPRPPRGPVPAGRTDGGQLVAGDRLPRADRRRTAMTHQLRSELLKLRTTSTTAVLLLAAAGLTLLAVFLEGLSPTVGELAKESTQREMFSAVTSAVLFATFAGVIAVTSEFRYGTIRPTVLIEPRRRVVLGAKLVAAAMIGVAFGVICVGIAFGAGIPFSRCAASTWR